MQRRQFLFLGVPGQLASQSLVDYAKKLSYRKGFAIDFIGFADVSTPPREGIYKITEVVVPDLDSTSPPTTEQMLTAAEDPIHLATAKAVLTKLGFESDIPHLEFYVHRAEVR